MTYEDLKKDFFKWRHTVNKVNRYYDNTHLLDLLCDNADLFEHDIPQGRRFYRGRIFNLDDIVSSYEQYESWMSAEDVFQGYDKVQSSAPLARFATEGRLNGAGISFLYTCGDIKTVIRELRPTIKEQISVAEFVAQKNLVFADLTQRSADEIKVPLLSDLLWLIAKEFSIPHYAGHNYSFTQYLAGQLMNLDFDGVIFESSLNTEGYNYVFFYPKDCEAINSQLYEVENIEIPFKNITRKDIR